MRQPHYYESIQQIVDAESDYFLLRGKYGENDGIVIEAFIEFDELKKDHEARFGHLAIVNGRWA